MINILMAEDHAIVREGMKHLFKLTNDICVKADAVNGSQVLKEIRLQEFDLILLDMTMPGISGVSLISRIRVNCPEVPILVLSMHNEAQIARRALNSGAAGYMTKDSEPELLLAAIRKVAAGGNFIDPELAGQMVFDNHGKDQQGAHTQLTEREYEILLLLARGNSLNEIADELKISNKTVSTHKMRLMKKMHFGNNADLIRYAIVHELIG